MKDLLAITFLFVVFISCEYSGAQNTENSVRTEFQQVKNGEYELSKPNEGLKRVLLLFGGYPEKAEDIKREFKILELAMEKGIAVVYMNYNQKLWLEESEKQNLAEQIMKIFSENELPRNSPYFGGFSSGGNVALLISDYLTRQNSDISPKGVFVIDPPVDLAALYTSSEKNIERDFSKLSIQESTWLLETLGAKFGDPIKNISEYEAYSIYTSETNNIDNIRNLKNSKIRFYTEPDTSWWKENRMAEYDQMNAYYLKQLSETLKNSNFEKVEYIPTKNKGIRANGERHPHSWSIVDEKDLIEWISK